MASPVFAAETIPVEAKQIIPIEVFEQLTCPHCQAEKEFLNQLMDKRDDISVSFYDIALPKNYELFKAVTEVEDLVKATPITLIGTTIIQGFARPETTGKQIEELIDQRQGLMNYTFADLVEAGGLAKIKKSGETCADGTACDINIGADNAWFVSVPFVGPVDIKQFSLPVMSIVLGFVDGFNPCAMWVLVTFLVVLAQLGSRKKMWQVAGLFILAEAIMYYLILNVWFTAWDFVGLDNLITPIIGLVAIGGGLYFLYEWRTNNGTCTIITGKKKEKTTKRINEIVGKPMTFVGIIGIIILAFSVNVVEFACSIGIPQAFTKIIELNNLGFWPSQWYMILYILFYMVDDFVVFGIALYSFDKIGITTKYSRLSNLIGGILMLLLGLLLIFKRDLLIFF